MLRLPDERAATLAHGAGGRPVEAAGLLSWSWNGSPFLLPLSLDHLIRPLPRNVSLALGLSVGDILRPAVRHSVAGRSLPYGS